MLKNYIKIALKVLRRRKFFTFISLFAISFTLVTLMVAVAFLDHLFAPMAPETKAERTLNVLYLNMSGENSQWNGNPGYGFLDKHARGISNVEHFSIITEGDIVTSYLNGNEIKSALKRTDGEFWKIMEFNFLEGRPITDDDDKNANFVAVINEATRQKFFGDQSALGKYIEADRQRFQVIGVVENVPDLRYIAFSDIWVPNSTSPRVDYKEQLMGSCLGIMLARDKSDFELIKHEFQSRLKDVAFPDPEYTRMEGTPETMFEGIARETFDTNRADVFFGIIVLLMLLFMLLPTINLVNINISRILERSSEIGVRKSFGASSWTLIGQFIVENLILTMIGGLIGFLFASIVIGVINNSGLIPYAQLQMNLRIFGYSFIIIIVFGLLSGVYPAWKMSRLHPVLALKGATR